MANRRFDAVIFDMDGVLVDSEPVHFASAVILLKQFGVEFTEAANREFLGSTDRRMFEVLRVRHRLPDSVDELVRRRKEIFFGLIASNGIPWREGIRELVADLAADGYRLAVASSGLRRIVEHVLESGDIRRHFTAVVTADDVATPKPAPDIYRETIRRLEVEPPRCAALEDTDVGVRAAKAAGVFAIACPTVSTRDMDFSSADLVAADVAAVRRWLLPRSVRNGARTSSG